MLGRDTNETVALDIVRRAKTTPVTARTLHALQGLSQQRGHLQAKRAGGTEANEHFSRKPGIIMAAGERYDQSH